MNPQNIWERINTTVQRFGWEERLVIFVLILASLIAVAVYVARRVRRGFEQSTPTISDHLTDFRRMRDEGQIDDKEYNRVINAVSQSDLNEQFRISKDDTSTPAKPLPPTQ
jgi:uncharacterized membrane protein